MAGSHNSYFSYSPSRPYPFRWFTPVAILGAVVLTALFSVLNFAANGYVLGSRFVADPNSTLAEKSWFQKPPFSYQSKLSATCQPANIPPATQLTGKSGFQYDLGNVWTQDETGALASLPSLTYLNNSFTDCIFQGVQIVLDNSDPESNGPFWVWNGDSNAIAYVTCLVDNGQPQTYLNLSITVGAGLQGSLADDGYGFLKAKKHTQASLWFGQLLMWLNFNQMLYQIAQVDVLYPGLLTSSGMFIARDTNQDDILQDNFMEISNQTAGYGAYYNIAGGHLFFWYHGTPIRELLIGNVNIGKAIDYFTKAFYSFVMADLGQTASPNALAAPEILSTFWTTCNDAVDHSNHNTFAPTGSLGASTFEALKQMTGPIGIYNTTLNAEYLCQIPQRRDTASIVVALIVADLVLLQAAWKVFTWITTFWLEKKDPESKYCAGCAKHLETNVKADGLAERAASYHSRQSSGQKSQNGTYEMLRGSVVGSGTTQYAKLASVNVGDVEEDGLR